MKYLITLCLFLFASTQINAQWWGKSIKGNGEMKTESRSVGDYDQISVAGFFSVTLEKGTEGTLILEGESNLLENVITEVEGDRLVIKVKNKQSLKTSWGKEIKIIVPFEDLSKVSLSGSGEIRGKDIIKAESFYISVSGSGNANLEVIARTTESRVTGSGNLSLAGSTKNHTSSVTGSGDLEAGRFMADTVDAKVTGSGDLRIACKKSIRARVTGSGDILYIGNPEKQDTKVSGSGDITRG